MPAQTAVAGCFHLPEGTHVASLVLQASETAMTWAPTWPSAATLVFCLQSTEPWSDEYYAYDIEQCLRDAGYTEVRHLEPGLKRGLSREGSILWVLSPYHSCLLWPGELGTP
eukprot:scaffold63644_cov20-Tisochrysis_lutea.AAC.1